MPNMIFATDDNANPPERYCATVATFLEEIQVWLFLIKVRCPVFACNLKSTCSDCQNMR